MITGEFLSTRRYVPGLVISTKARAHRSPGEGIDTDPATADGYYTYKKVRGNRIFVPAELDRGLKPSPALAAGVSGE